MLTKGVIANFYFPLRDVGPKMLAENPALNGEVQTVAGDLGICILDDNSCKYMTCKYSEDVTVHGFPNHRH
jgi:hypothetical protein